MIFYKYFIAKSSGQSCLLETMSMSKMTFFRDMEGVSHIPWYMLMIYYCQFM
jgi:hypothetical protein